MANNFLEQVVSEWYEHRGSFVRRNVPVGARARGGHECELDIIAFDPLKHHLVHVEASLDADSWAKRERSLRRKFDAGLKYIPGLFPGTEVRDIEQIAIFALASRTNHPTIAGRRVLLVSDLMREIIEDLSDRKISSAAVAEHHPILRTLQFVVQYRRRVFDTLR